MSSFFVVVAFNVLENGRANTLTIHDFTPMEPLHFERMKEALSNCAVVAASRSAHALSNLMALAILTKVSAGVLAATIGMEDDA